ncbi:MAG TPA: STAS domain-containing protein [Planococcus sp. (in: firmicutes)]|nr:STAS domain-containing protein [Planococcus sp. (in: firmicutes)]
MNREIVRLGERVTKDNYLIAQLIHEEVTKDKDPQELERSEAFLQQVTEFRAGFIALLGHSIQNYLDEQKMMEKIDAWGYETGTHFWKQGMTLDQAIVETAIYRKHISKVIQTEVIQQEMSIQTIFDVMDIFHQLLDKAVYSYSSSYLEAYQKDKRQARKEFLELSAPVVPVSEQIAVLPLVGNIESDRAQYLLEMTLLSASQLRVTTLIIDMSGVSKVDAMVAEQILKVIGALKLIGVEAVLTGIRPDTAQLMVQLGISVNDLMIGGSLKKALGKLFVLR